MGRREREERPSCAATSDIVLLVSVAVLVLIAASMLCAFQAIATSILMNPDIGHDTTVSPSHMGALSLGVVVVAAFAVPLVVLNVGSVRPRTLQLFASPFRRPSTRSRRASRLAAARFTIGLYTVHQVAAPNWRSNRMFAD